jgi:hypothetical protein
LCFEPALQHPGFAIPPQTHTGWVGEAGPGLPAETTALAAGTTTRSTAAFTAWILMHRARLLKQAGGMPSEGNQKTRWDDGFRFDHPNPEYR